MTTPASGIQPPIASHAASVPGAGGVIRPRQMRVWAHPLSIPGLEIDDHELRRIWVALIGPGAVEDLLKLMGAARRRERVLRPLFLRPLIEAGLAAVNRDVIWVPELLPPVPEWMVARLPRLLRHQYRDWQRRRLSPNGEAA